MSIGSFLSSTSIQLLCRFDRSNQLGHELIDGWPVWPHRRRYRIEKAVMAGELEPAALPAVWGQGMQELLGVTAPISDAEVTDTLLLLLLIALNSV